MALEALTAVVTGSATTVADLTMTVVARSTKAFLETLYVEPASTITLRSTKAFVETLYVEPASTITLRSTKSYLEVLYTQSVTLFTAGISGSGVVGADLADLVGNELFTAAVTTNTVVAADVSIPILGADITATATLVGSMTGTRQFDADILGTGGVNADILSFVQLTAAITASGDITTNIRENIEYLESDITAEGDVTTELSSPWHAGNTLNLTHSATAETVLSRSFADTLSLQQQVDLVFGQRSLSASSQIVFTHNVTIIRVLPTKTASNVLVLTDTLVDYREVTSYFALQDTAIGVIDYIDASTLSVLNLTDTVSTAGTVFNLSASNQLNLTHVVDSDKEGSLSVLSNLDLHQNAFVVALTEQKYILLQAPFELIQTSVILPNPLLDDNENLVSNLILRRSMDNTQRTYVQTSANRRLRYTFTLNRLKSLELEAFFDSYSGADIKILNWKGEMWRVKLITNPIDYVQTRRAEPGGDRTDVNMEFEGVLLNG